MQMTLANTITRKVWTRNQVLVNAMLVVLGSLLIAAMAQVRIALPFTPVPVTGQTFAVLLVAAALGSRLGPAAVAAYIAEGAMGLPVFAGGGAGAAWLAGPTGGYLAGFMAAAILVGWLAEKGLDRKLATAIAAFAAGTFVIYAAGALWLSIYVGFDKALATGVAPFIAGDVIKAVLAGLALPAAWKVIRPLQ